MSDKLRIFETNNLDSLYAIALNLWSKKVFDYYLTNQQLLVLDQIFNDSQNKKELFKAFLDSKIFLKFYEAEPTEKEQEKDQETTPVDNENNNNTPKDNNQDSQKDQDQQQQQQQQQESSEENLNESTISNGVESARALSLKVRYILWEKAIDFYYDSEGKNIDEYEIFENEEPEQPKVQEVPTSIEPARKIDEDEDYDDDEDEEEEAGKPNDNEQDEKNQETITRDQDENGNIILEVPIAQNDTSQLDNKILIDNFNKIYHNFENDRETLIKRRKLEENDKLLLEDQNTGSIKDTFAMNLGAANLSLKHLLQSIDDNKEKLNLQDNELRQLIMDVRKNRSKWASDDKIGQEELYEACEKVVMELRGYTEHSTAFLNKVSKREAPNYAQVIKKPMDLNTILKKLKNFQYKSKTEFVDDVMLIWKNCLTYNSDPKHFLRAHAIAMQKKSLTLIPIIPDITIRDRSEVEAENEDPSTPAPSGGAMSSKTTSKKGKKRTRSGEEKDSQNHSEPPQSEVGTPAADHPLSKAIPSTSASKNGANSTLPTSTASTPAPSNIQTTAAANTSQILPADTTEAEEEDQGDSNEYLNQEDNDKDDLEIQTWKNLTAKARADFCMKRSDLFKDNKLNSESEAILRDSRKMNNFQSYLKNYSENKKHVKSSHNRSQEEDPYLIEYDVTGGFPSLPYKGVDDDELERHESKLIDEVIQKGLKPSPFAPIDGGLNKIINENIEEMQEIRKICFKISLIRQMQQQQFVHHTQLKPPEIEKIDDSIDIDPVSRLENHDKLNKELIYFVMRKRIGKIAMQNGFESTELFAVDTLTQIAGDYMDNLVKSIKTHLETPSINKNQKEKNVLLLSLLQNGLNKPDELHTYVTENILKQNGKLKDLKIKISGFLKALLRPAIEMTEKNFTDNSEQFLSGDFSNEIGEDFFGFKELGLDKEFSMLGNSIPLHLLQSKFNEANSIDDPKKIHREEFENAPFKRLSQDDIEKEIQLLQPFLRDCLAKTKHYHTKQMKSKREINEYLSEAKGVIILDDEDYPKKPSKPKLPPTGKITPSKKKITPQTFFLPEEDDKKNGIKSELGVPVALSPIAES